jgi:hypothetical protein
MEGVSEWPSGTGVLPPDWFEALLGEAFVFASLIGAVHCVGSRVRFTFR